MRSESILVSLLAAAEQVWSVPGCLGTIYMPPEFNREKVCASPVNGAGRILLFPMPHAVQAIEFHSAKKGGPEIGIKLLPVYRCCCILVILFS